MKYIFCIHSPITYIVALSVIKFNNISTDDVLILSDGFSVNSDQIRIIDYSHKYRGSKGLINSITRNLGQFIDKSVSDFVGDDPFESFVPVMRFIEKRLITHKNCCKFSFIEEGLAHYFSEENLETLVLGVGQMKWRISLFSSLKLSFKHLIRGYNTKLQALPFSYSSYTAIKSVMFYGIDSNTFPLAPLDQRIVVPLELPNNLSGLLSETILWIGSNNPSFYKRSLKKYLAGFEEFLGNIDKSKKLFVKFHRGESQESIQGQILLINKYDINYEELPTSFIIEPALANSKKVEVFGLDSSLLYYAASFGHKAYSIHRVLSDMGYYSGNEATSRNMDFYWKKVNLI